MAHLGNRTVNKMKSRFTVSQALVEKGRPRKYLRLMESGETWSIADLAETDGSTYQQAKTAVWRLGVNGFIKANPKSSKYAPALYHIEEAGFQEIEEADRMLFVESNIVLGETIVQYALRTQPTSAWDLGARA
jgi:hypothetical protein